MMHRLKQTSQTENILRFFLSGFSPFLFQKPLILRIRDCTIRSNVMLWMQIKTIFGLGFFFHISKDPDSFLAFAATTNTGLRLTVMWLPPTTKQSELFPCSTLFQNFSSFFLSICSLAPKLVAHHVQHYYISINVFKHVTSPKYILFVFFHAEIFTYNSNSHRAAGKHY